MTFSAEQFKALSNYEEYFNTAVNASWSRYPGHAAVMQILSILNVATNRTKRINASCQKCVLDLITECGTLYLADKQEYIDKANAETAVKMMAEAAPKRKKSPAKVKRID